MSSLITHVRAKFYVSAINHNAAHNGHLTTQVHLNASYSPNPDSENHKFWKASPNGKAVMYPQPGDDPEQWKLGQHYYLDFAPIKAEDAKSGPNTYRLLELDQVVDSSSPDDYPRRIRVKFVAINYYNTIEVSIDNQRVIDFHRLGAYYTVTFSPAPSG